MLFDIELGSVPASELPNLLNCLCKTVVNHNANIKNEDGDDYESSFDDCVTNAKAYKHILLKSLKTIKNLKDVSTDMTMVKPLLNNELEEDRIIANIINETTAKICISNGDLYGIAKTMILRLLPICDDKNFKEWFRMNIKDYIDIFIEFAEMPIDGGQL